jgi:tRNA-specific 2-thiouridylase
LVIGKHDGVYYYTIGQRHGLDIKTGKGPYFVIKKDIKKNVIYVGSEKDLYTKKAKIKNIHWIKKPEKFPVQLDVRTRYRAPLIKAGLKKSGEIIFQKPDRAITSGQSAVFYKGSTVLGGGVIS